MNRDYDGTPIDITWDSGPWANDGETIEATDSDQGEITTTMDTNDAPELTRNNRAAVATYVRSQLLNGAAINDLEEHYSTGTINRAAKGEGSFENVGADVSRLECDGRGPSSEWVTVDEEQQPEPETEPTLEGQTVSKQPSTINPYKATTLVAILYVVYRVVRGVLR